MIASSYQTTFLLTIFLHKHFIERIEIIKAQKAQKNFTFSTYSLRHSLTVFIKISIILRCHTRKMPQTNIHSTTIFEIVATIKRFGMIFLINSELLRAIFINKLMDDKNH